MSLISKIKNKNKLFVLLDINSSSVGGAIFSIKNKNKVKVLFSTREFFKIEKELNTEDFLQITIKSLKIVISKICFQGIGKIDNFFCFLSSPWNNIQSRFIKLEKKSPFIISEDLINKLIDKEINQIKEEYIKNNKYNFGEIIPIEKKVMSVYLNGYRSNSPYAKKAKRLEINLFTSIIEEEFKKKIEEIISQHFHFEDIHFHSALMSNFLICNDMFVNYDDFILLNISGEITDLSIIKKNTIKDLVSFPLGYNCIVRNLSKELDYTIEESKSFLSLYKENHMSSTKDSHLSISLNKSKKEWISLFQESLHLLSNDISIPKTIFITVDEKFEEFFSEIIKEEQLNQYTLTESNFKILFLNTKFLHGIVNFLDEKIKKDAILIMESLYINNILNKK